MITMHIRHIFSVKYVPLSSNVTVYVNPIFSPMCKYYKMKNISGRTSKSSATRMDSQYSKKGECDKKVTLVNIQPSRNPLH